LDSLKRNAQSSSPDDPESNDGSYNLASMILQGNGNGIGQPASKTVIEEAVEIVGRVDEIISALYRLVVPNCMSKEEFDVTDFHSIDNNTFGFGGLDPNNMGLQLNVSSLIAGGLRKALISPEQGSWHNDKGDDFSRWTMFILVLRVPPGILHNIYTFNRIY
jgi:hypothetical protein